MSTPASSRPDGSAPVDPLSTASIPVLDSTASGPGAVDRTGVVVSVTLPGADDATVFRADVAGRLPEPGRQEPMDVIRLVWHGRRRVPGVMPGEWLRMRGRIVDMAGVPTLHNPEFALVDAPA